MEEVCAHCGQHSVAALRRCTGCWQVRYCSRDCQKRHWSRHKVTCSASASGQKKKRDKSKDGGNSKPSVGQRAKSTPQEKDGGKNGQPASVQSSSSLFVCRTCKTKTKSSAVVKCERCQDVTYCSRDCRRADRQKHLDTCIPLDSKAEDHEETEKTVTSPGTEQGATPSEEGATASKSEDAPGAAGNEDSGAETDSVASHPELSEERDKNVKVCHKCKTSKPNLKRCGRCLDVTYCSRDCQKADWLSHKAACQPIEVLTTDGYRETERREQAAKRQEEANRLVNLLFQNRLSTATRTQQRLTWQEAKRKAARMFPFQRIVDDFDNLDSDFMDHPLLFWMNSMRRGAGVVALGRLTTSYFHPFRPARYVKDVNGMSVYVIFYASVTPWQYFSYAHLKEGNYICIEEAFLHLFADGSIGFRINDVDDVRIIESLP